MGVILKRALRALPDPNEAARRNMYYYRLPSYVVTGERLTRDLDERFQHGSLMDETFEFRLVELMSEQGLLHYEWELVL